MRKYEYAKKEARKIIAKYWNERIATIVANYIQSADKEIDQYRQYMDQISKADVPGWSKDARAILKNLED